MSSETRYVVVVGIDFSDLGNSALDQALETASLRENAEVHVVHVEPEARFDGPLLRPTEAAANAEEALKLVQQRASERVDALGSRLDRGGLKRVVAHLRRGSASESIAQFAADLDADLVVVGSHGHRGLERLFLGSVAERVSRLVRCPVWIVRPKDHSTAGRVPEIEPPCPDCVKHRNESGGAELWCARHSEPHLRPHRYSYRSDGIYSPETTAYEATPEGR